IAAQKAAVYDEIVFATEPPTVQTLWPAQCLQNSKGVYDEVDANHKSMSAIINKNEEDLLSLVAST
ncbi:hypothetical protein BSL78_27666, partial [Apostichopus japonicus]